MGTPRTDGRGGIMRAIRVGEALTKSRKSKADLGGAIL